MERKPRKPFIFKVGDNIKGCLILEQLTIITPKKGRDEGLLTKSYKCRCNICGYEYTRTEKALELSGGEEGCACCKRKIVVEHINSIVANEETHWMVDYFPGGWNEAKLYMSGSEKKVFFKCPHCGKIKDKPMRIADLYKRRTISCDCQVGRISYGERICMNALKMLNIEYVYQYNTEWSENRIYDFYIPSLNCIIEIHGEQHYRDRGYFRQELGEQQKIDKQKEQMARENGIERYYQVNCSKSHLRWIKDSLTQIKEINWENVDWVECCSNGEVNLAKELCLYKEVHPLCTCKELCELFSISTFTVKTYVSKGYDLGWCSSKEFKRKEVISHNSRAIAVYKNGELVKEYVSLLQCAKHSEQDLGVKLSKETVRRYCEGTRKPKGNAKEFMFMFNKE